MDIKSLEDSLTISETIKFRDDRDIRCKDCPIRKGQK